MERTAEMQKGISANTLKWIAVITMFIDHIGAAIVEKIGVIAAGNGYYMFDQILRGIGRVSFPIYCFLLIEGVLHTHNKLKYCLNMFAFAVVSEIPFDLAFMGRMSFNKQNVFMTLLFGLMALIFIQIVEQKMWKFGIVVELLIGTIFAAVAQLCHTDYGAIGVALIFILYIARDDRIKQCFCGALCFLWEITSVFSFVFIFFYNGIRKKGINKYFFYLFYPLHLLVLYAIRIVFF